MLNNSLYLLANISEIRHYQEDFETDEICQSLKI